VTTSSTACEPASTAVGWASTTPAARSIRGEWKRAAAWAASIALRVNTKRSVNAGQQVGLLMGILGRKKIRVLPPNPDAILVCKRCRQSKRRVEFPNGPRTTRPDSTCKKCRSDLSMEYERRKRAKDPAGYAKRRSDAAWKTSLLREYGITPEVYQALFEAQGGRCAICRRESNYLDPRYGKTRRLAVDHDHNTGKIRGLLCNQCNTALGKLGDSATSVMRAVEYLRRAGSE
jgi:hypothetical protein